MSQIMKTFLGVFLIMFMVVTSSGVLSGFMTVVEAQNLHAQVINELEDSDYDSSVAQTCFENASKAGDTLELKLYMTDNSIRTVTDASQITSSDEIEKARVELKFTYAVACAERICVVVLFLWILLYKRGKTDGAFNRRIGRKRYYASFRQWSNRCARVCVYSAVITTELIKKVT